MSNKMIGPKIMPVIPGRNHSLIVKCPMRANVANPKIDAIISDTRIIKDSLCVAESALIVEYFYSYVNTVYHIFFYFRIRC